MKGFVAGSSSGRTGVAAEPPEMMEALVQRVRTLRPSLESSEGYAESTAALLGNYDYAERLSEIDAALRPIQVSRKAPQNAHDNIDRAIKAANDILAQVVTAREAEAAILKGPHEHLESYLKSVGHLKEVVGFFSLKENFKSCERFLNDINILLSKSSLMTEEEFKNLMFTHSTPIEPNLLLGWPSKPQWASDGDAEAIGGNSGDSKHPSKSLATYIYKTPTLILPGILPLLHALAQQLVQDGNQQSCYRIYRDARSSALELSLQKLGVEKLSKDDVERMQFEGLEAKIGKWTQFMRFEMRLLLLGERELCDEVFDGISFNKDQCVAELEGTGVLTLLSSGDAFSKSKRSPEKLFLLLDMYEVMHKLRSEAEAAILKGPHEHLESYLKSVGHLKEVVGFFSLKENFKSCERFLNDINILLSKSSLMTEEEFKILMFTHSTPIEPNLLLGWPSKPQWASDGDAEAIGGNCGDSKHPSKSLATYIYKTPTLILPGILPLLHALAQQLATVKYERVLENAKYLSDQAKNNGPSNRPTDPAKKSTLPALPTVLPSSDHSRKKIRKRPVLPSFLDNVNKDMILFWSLNGEDDEELVEDYDDYLKSARRLGLEKGVRISAHNIFLREKIIYTTPNTEDPVYAVVHNEDDLVVFIIKADEWWTKGYHVDGQFYEMIPEKDGKRYIEGANLLTFGGNHRDLCDGKPEQVVIGPHLVRDKLKMLRTPRGRLDPLSVSPFVLYLCEGPLIKQAGMALKKSLLSSGAKRLVRENEKIGLLIINWRFLSRIILHCMFDITTFQLKKEEIKKWKGIPESSTYIEAMQTMRMVYIKALAKDGIPVDPRVVPKKYQKYNPRNTIIQRGGLDKSNYHTDTRAVGLKVVLDTSSESSICNITEAVKKKEPQIFSNIWTTQCPQVDVLCSSQNGKIRIAKCSAFNAQAFASLHRRRQATGTSPDDFSLHGYTPRCVPLLPCQGSLGGVTRLACRSTRFGRWAIIPSILCGG